MLPKCRSLVFYTFTASSVLRRFSFLLRAIYNTEIRHPTPASPQRGSAYKTGKTGQQQPRVKQTQRSWCETDPVGGVLIFSFFFFTLSSPSSIELSISCNPPSLVSSSFLPFPGFSRFATLFLASRVELLLPALEHPRHLAFDYSNGMTEKNKEFVHIFCESLMLTFILQVL